MIFCQKKLKNYSKISNLCYNVFEEEYPLICSKEEKIVKKRLLFITGAVAVTLFIFGNSLQDAAESSAASGGIVDTVMHILAYLGFAPRRDIIVFAVRKTAHITEFAAQAVMLAGCFDFPYRRRIIYILFFGLFTACTDEFIQLFSDGRAGMIQDVFIDFTGTVLGTVFAGIFRRIFKKINRGG